MIGYWHHTASVGLALCTAAFGLEKLYRRVHMRRLPVHFFGNFRCTIYRLDRKHSERLKKTTVSSMSSKRLASNADFSSIQLMLTTAIPDKTTVCSSYTVRRTKCDRLSQQQLSFLLIVINWQRTGVENCLTLLFPSWYHLGDSYERVNASYKSRSDMFLMFSSFSKHSRKLQCDKLL